MHPALCERLVRLQLDRSHELFGDKVRLESFQFPLLFIEFTNHRDEKRLLRFDCTDYDYQPMAVEPVDSLTRKPLPKERWLKRGGGEFPSHHMKDNGPFICLPGLRDYYTHQGHLPKLTSERWEQHRSSRKIPHIIEQFAQRFASGQWE